MYRGKYYIDQTDESRVLFKNISNIEVSGGGDVICETPVNVPELVGNKRWR
jgi:hypothetical protein